MNELFTLVRSNTLAQDKLVVLLGDGVDINAQDEQERTPLLLACEESYSDIAKILLRAGAGADKRDSWQYCNALDYALEGDDVELVQVLRKKLIDENEDTGIPYALWLRKYGQPLQILSYFNNTSGLDTCLEQAKFSIKPKQLADEDINQLDLTTRVREVIASIPEYSKYPDLMRVLNNLTILDMGLYLNSDDTDFDSAIIDIEHEGRRYRLHYFSHNDYTVDAQVKLMLSYQNQSCLLWDYACVRGGDGKLSKKQEVETLSRFCQFAALLGLGDFPLTSIIRFFLTFLSAKIPARHCKIEEHGLYNFIKKTDLKKSECNAKPISELTWLRKDEFIDLSKQLSVEQFIDDCGGANQALVTLPTIIECFAEPRQLIDNLLTQGADINYQNEQGATVLMQACELSRVDLCKHLITQGADINQTDNWGQTPLMMAMRSLECVDLLLQHNVDVNCEDEFGLTPLHFACHSADEKIVKSILNSGVTDIDHRDNEERTALMLACFPNTNVAKLLIEQGADIAARDVWNDSPFLHGLITRGLDEYIDILLELPEQRVIVYMDIFKAVFVGLAESACRSSIGQEQCFARLNALLNKGVQAEIDQEYYAKFIQLAEKFGYCELANLYYPKLSDKDLQSLLMLACQNNNIAAVRLCIEKKIDLDVHDNQGNPAIIIAAENGHAELVSLLLEQGADIHATNRVKNTVLIQACVGNHANVVKVLLDNKVDAQMPGEFKLSPLVYACRAGALETTALFLQHGLDVNAGCGFVNNTALMEAAKAGQLVMCELLIESGADIRAKNKSGKTAMDLACAANQHIIVDLFKDIKI